MQIVIEITIEIDPNRKKNILQWIIWYAWRPISGCIYSKNSQFLEQIIFFGPRFTQNVNKTIVACNTVMLSLRGKLSLLTNLFQICVKASNVKMLLWTFWIVPIFSLVHFGAPPGRRTYQKFFFANNNVCDTWGGPSASLQSRSDH